MNNLQRFAAAAKFVCLACSAFILFAGHVSSQDLGSGFYRLTNKWLGDGKALDVVNDGTNDKLQMADATGASGQSWKLTPVGDGYYRLTTKWLAADRSLNVVNDGTNSKVNLARSENVTGQFWKITPVRGGFYRLTTKWLGEERSLDVINDSHKNKLQLAETAEVTGQYWKISPASGKANSFGSIETGIHPISEFKKMTFAGFTVNVNPDLVGNDVTNRALDLLSADLTKITQLLTPVQLGRLRKVPIWIQYKLNTESGMWYHESKEWLVANGYPPELEKSVEIADVSSYYDQREIQPFSVLHEFAHAYNDLYLSAIQDKLKAAFNNAVKSGKYDKVERTGSGIERAYALTNEKEYFAELTEAYFGKNDYYPFNREELEKFDPTGYALMQAAWDK
jgi:hypothetical protein